MKPANPDNLTSLRSVPVEEKWNRAGSRSGRDAGWFWAAVLVSFLTIPGIAAEGNTPQPLASPLHTFVSFLTNCPPIRNALVEMKLDPVMRPTLCEFRYQSNGFFAREFCASNHVAGAHCPRDRMGGRWEDQYWYYDPGHREPLLYTYRYSATDTASTCYQHYRNFDILFGMFQSYGASDQGANSLRWQGDHFTFFDQHRRVSNAVRLHLSNGMPVGAFLARPMDQGHVMHLSYAYAHDTNVAPLGIPVQATVNTNLMSIKVQALAFSDPAQPLPQAHFVPAHVFADTNLAHVVYSNGGHYRVQHGRAAPMGALREQAERSARRRGTMLLGVFIVLILLVPIWVGLSRKARLHPQT